MSTINKHFNKCQIWPTVILLTCQPNCIKHAGTFESYQRASYSLFCLLYYYIHVKFHFLWVFLRGQDGRAVTLSSTTSDIGARIPARPEVGKLVVACCWSAVYSTEP